MIVLALKTDQPVAGLFLCQDGKPIAEHHWEAHRMLAKDLLTTLMAFLHDNGVEPQSIGGFVIYRGPGSFTGLRIGGSVANALAYGYGKPIVDAGGDKWLAAGLSRLDKGESDTIARLEYGGQIHITAPKK